jgi:hypothetical protein
VELDARLHQERTRGAHERAACAELPYGAVVSVDGRAWIVVDAGLRARTHDGYADHQAWPREHVTVLTPPSTLAAMRAGWRPDVHPSARP